ncbi:MAG: hypothetical protein M3N30_02375 [Bacteroidota bacterium]|nr:hypothetical protein [Bacteroidota bacterium]
MIRSILLLSILFSAITLRTYSQDTIPLKRAAYKLNVAVDNESFYAQDIKEAPYVLPDKTIQLYPGETVYIEVEQENGTIKNLKAVNEIKDSSKTVIISFSQTVKKRVHENMMLKVNNPFPYQLIYEARIFRLVQKKWGVTDVYPVEAGLYGIEIWHEVIISIALSDWKLH